MTKRTPPSPQEHILVDLLVTKATCSCGAEFVLSSTLASSLSHERCQDELLDLYHQHRDVERDARAKSDVTKETQSHGEPDHRSRKRDRP